jgi:hypothetical protein
MALIGRDVKVEFQLTLKLTEEEARALDAICGYDPKDVCRVFYDHIGSAYLQPHEDGFVKLSKSVAERLRPMLTQVTTARKMLTTEPAKPASEPGGDAP